MGEHTPSTVAETVNTLAEESLLSTILTTPDAYDDVDGMVNSDDFSHPGYAAIFAAIVNCDAQGRPIDTVSIADELRRAGSLKLAGGLDTLENLRSADHHGDVLADTLTILKDHALRRRLYSASGQIIAKVRDRSLTGETLIADAESAVFSATAGNESGATWTPMAAIVADVHQRMATSSATRLIGVSTGLDELDRYTGGLRAGQLVLIGGRPGSGKSVLAMQIAAHIAATNDVAVPFLSYEMSCDEIGFRLLAAATGIDLQSLMRGVIPHDMTHIVAREAEKLAALPLLIDDKPPRTIGGVRSALRRLQRRRPIGAVVFDYLQLMSSDRNHEGRTQEVGDISRESKLLADELEVPVIACSQLSRQMMNRPDKRPQLSDLRESGSLEQDSSIVLFVHREHVFNNAAPADAAELILGKNRNGPTNVTIPLRWDGGAMRFRPQPAGYIPGQDHGIAGADDYF